MYHKMIHHYLMVSSMLMFLPILFYYTRGVYSIIETALATLLFFQICLALVFWYQPVKNSLIHYVDGRMAKVCIVVFSLYTLFLKNCYVEYKVTFLMCLLISLGLFFEGNEHSKREWCCRDHIIYHCWFHIFISMGCFFTFI